MVIFTVLLIADVYVSRNLHATSSLAHHAHAPHHARMQTLHLKYMFLHCMQLKHRHTLQERTCPVAHQSHQALVQ